MNNQGDGINRVLMQGSATDDHTAADQRTIKPMIINSVGASYTTPMVYDAIAVDWFKVNGGSVGDNFGTFTVTAIDTRSHVYMNDFGQSYPVEGGSMSTPVDTGTKGMHVKAILSAWNLTQTTGYVINAGLLTGIPPNNESGINAKAVLFGYDNALALIKQVEVTNDTTDAQGTSATGHLSVVGHDYNFNGTTWDRHRGNTSNIIIASAVRSATFNGAQQINYNSSGGHFTLNVTAVPGVQTVTPSIEASYDGVNYYTLLTGVAMVATGIQTLKIFPGSVVTANVSANDILPRFYRMTVTHSGAGNFTYAAYSNLVE